MTPRNHGEMWPGGPTVMEAYADYFPPDYNERAAEHPARWTVEDGAIVGRQHPPGSGTRLSHFPKGWKEVGQKTPKNLSKSTALEPMVGPEDVARTLISLDFSWAQIKSIPVSFRMVP